MKTRNIVWATLSVAAAFAMASCAKEINNIEEIPTEPETPAVKVIPYTVTVGDASASRTTVDDDNQTLRFAEGDKLYVTGENIFGELSIVSGVGQTSNATFSGKLTYDTRVNDFPSDDLSLTATLVSAEQNNDIEIKIDDDTYAVTVLYPQQGGFFTSLNEAVRRYSNLTGTSTYGEKSFSLTQQTAFLSFVITFEDRTFADQPFIAYVHNNGSQLCAGDVKTTAEGYNVVARFVLPVAAGTVLNGATVQIGSKDPISFGSAGKTLDGKVYNVNKTQPTTGDTYFTLAESRPGMIVADNGRAYFPGHVPGSLEHAGMVAYKQGNNGRVIALADAGQMNWNDAWNGAANHTPKVQIFGKDEEYYSWRLPYSDLDWEIMIGAFSGFEGLNNALTAAGGSESTLKSGAWYWTASTIEEDEMECGMGFQIFGTYEPVTSYKNEDYYVRACFDF